MMKTWMIAVATLMLSLSGEALAHPVVVAGPPPIMPPPPPAPVVVVQPVRPTLQHYWVDGRWAWNGYRYVWSPGYWAAPVAYAPPAYGAPRYVAAGYGPPARPVVVARPVPVPRPGPRPYVVYR